MKTVYRFPDSPSTHIYQPEYICAPVYWLGTQWAVTSYGLETRDGTYGIERERIHETHPGWSWERHVGQKEWCDPDELAEALAFARAKWPKGVPIPADPEPPRPAGTFPQLGCMIAWDPFSISNRRDRVRVGPHPDLTGWSNLYRSTDGACYAHLHEAKEWKRVAHLFITFNTLVVRDGLDPQAVHRAFLAINEYRARIAPDTPGADR